MTAHGLHIPLHQIPLPGDYHKAPKGYSMSPEELPAPASPADDEATVKAIVRHMSTHSYVASGECARDLLAAIRRGEVPGLTTMEALEANRFMLRAKLRQAKDEVEQLKAEVERLRAIVDGYGKALANAPKLPETELELARERDAAIARAEKAERNSVNVKLALDAERRMNDENRCKIQANLDSSRAAHAEAMGLLREIAKCDSGNIYSTVPHGDMSRVKNYIAKYDKTERHEPFPDYLKGA